MKIICISGGSYKSCYLNYLQKLKFCDLLIINFGVMYVCNNNTRDNFEIVGNELFLLARRLQAVVVAGIEVVDNNTKRRVLMHCDGEKVIIDNTILLKLKKHRFIVCSNKSLVSKYDKIVLSEGRITPNIQHCNYRKRYIFCDSYGVSIVENRKLKRKFYKYSKIILK